MGALGHYPLNFAIISITIEQLLDRIIVHRNKKERNHTETTNRRQAIMMEEKFAW